MRVHVVALTLLAVAVFSHAAATPVTECDVLLGFKGWTEDLVDNARCNPKTSCPVSVGDLKSNYVDCTPLFGETAVITGLRLRYSFFDGYGGARGPFAGPLPTNLTQVPTLEGLYLNDNTFTGALPAEWSALTNLKELFLSGNLLDSTLPAAWSALTKLTDLRIANQTIHGTLPDAWSALKNLHNLDLSNTNLTGPIPAGWTALTSLGGDETQGLDVSNTTVCLATNLPSAIFQPLTNPDRCLGSSTEPPKPISSNTTSSPSPSNGVWNIGATFCLVLAPVAGLMFLA